MRLFKIFILSFTTFLSNAQESTDLILTIEQNEKWLRTIDKQDLAGQLALLKVRLLADTNVFAGESYPDRTLEKGKRTYEK